MFFYSVAGVRESIWREKATQLDALRERIRGQRSAVLGEAAAPAGEGAQLANLIAYHDLIERAPEWPFDAPMIARLALFAGLGLGSWLGGALVERLLESWF
jgi:capsular polysaccharide biosynthesis protein